MRPRLLPLALAAMAMLLLAKAESLLRPWTLAAPGVAQASSAAEPARLAAPPPPAPPPPATPPPAAAPDPPQPSPEQLAERALLESLRARRAELDSRDASLRAREVVAAGAERRLGERIAELAALQQRLEDGLRAAGEREEAGWRQLVRLYEGMRPRDAAAILDELELPVLVQLIDRMREAKAAPLLGAMRPDRARLLTAELARHRARPPG